MSSRAYCPYCDTEFYVMDIYDISDGLIAEGFATCPECHKAFVHHSELAIDFNIQSVEGCLEFIKKCVGMLGMERYKPKQAFLEKLVAYNKKINDGVLTEEEIEAYSDEWSDGYERME